MPERADVWFYEAFAEETAALRQRLPAAVRAGFTPATIQESGHAAPPARLISIRTQSLLPADWAGQLDAIISRTTGYDHLVALPVAAGYLPRYCARAVAEQAALLWLALLRKLPQQMQQFERFDRDGLTGAECAGRRLLCVGVGHIGHEIVRIARGLGMAVRGVDLVRRHADVEYVSIEEGLPWAEVIVSAMNLTAANGGYFSRERLARARRGVVFVNIARGELAPTADLVALLEEGHLGGVGLDVYDHEPALATALRSGAVSSDPVLRLRDRPNAVLTPHNAFNTAEALARKADQTAEQVRLFLAEHRLRWPVPAETHTGVNS